MKTLKALFLLGNSSPPDIKFDSIPPEQLQASIAQLFGSTETSASSTPSTETSGSAHSKDGKGFDGVEFVMSWQRRISESEMFFQLMKKEGFFVHHHGKCTYSFFLLYQPAETTDETGSDRR